ncbi:hypothetical protein TD95_004210 [Thielaviopsis punctulata]|uniref:DUF4536 domain-containing protein n=1 Tax=Thielaviopsis punctulata TaxID=72032 RepID=A0A0F4ZJ51_9PEZI|nr:hypothetical protein TD95_004210 [Thielaviopsis punctulata]
MNDKTPSLHQLERPEKLSQVLKAEVDEDCLPCKVIGSGAFLSLSAFNYFSGMSQLEKRQAEILRSGSMFGMRSRRFGIAGISVGLAYLGLYRLMA